MPAILRDGKIIKKCELCNDMNPCFGNMRVKPSKWYCYAHWPKRKAIDDNAQGLPAKSSD